MSLFAWYCFNHHLCKSGMCTPDYLVLWETWMLSKKSREKMPEFCVHLCNINKWSLYLSYSSAVQAECTWIKGRSRCIFFFWPLLVEWWVKKDTRVFENICVRVCVCVCWTRDFSFSVFPVKHEGVYHCVYYCSLVCHFFVCFCNCSLLIISKWSLIHTQWPNAQYWSGLPL